MIAQRILPKENSALFHGMMVGAFLFSAMPAFNSAAQTLDSSGDAETIVGSEIATDEAEPDDVADDVIAAIEKSAATADQIKTMFRVGDFHIVFLGDPEKVDSMTEVQSALEDNSDAVTGLREAIDGSAVFYTALDTNNLEVENVVSATVTEDKKVTVYVIGAAP